MQHGQVPDNSIENHRPITNSAISFKTSIPHAGIPIQLRLLRSSTEGRRRKLVQPYPALLIGMHHHIKERCNHNSRFYFLPVHLSHAEPTVARDTIQPDNLLQNSHIPWSASQRPPNALVGDAFCLFLVLDQLFCLGHALVSASKSFEYLANFRDASFF